MPFSPYKTARLRFIFVVYWIFLLYIIAALVWWFIALEQQNRQMTEFELSQLKADGPQFLQLQTEIMSMQRRKTAQYVGEGSIFLLLILSGAVFIYRAVRRQFRLGQQQQNFMMAITHELKTPIAVTKLNLETLQKRKLEDSQQQRLIQNTIQEANRLNSLCNNLLLASQIEAGNYSITKEAINLSQLVTDCINDFENRFPQRIFHRNLEKDIDMLGDILMLQMAINNLIDNAIKYSPKDSVVTVLLRKANSRIELEVKDEGKGIETAEKKKVFDKFYRVGNNATKQSRGTGLGLFVTKKIAADHDASIFVTDNQPAGTSFKIVFAGRDQL